MHAFVERPAVSEISALDAVKPDLDLGPSAPVLQSRKPIVEWIPAIGVEVYFEASRLRFHGVISPLENSWAVRW
jgi:hypothetical protein